MARNRKPSKPYRPMWNGAGVKLLAEPWRIDAVFRRLEYILDALDRDGTVTATAAVCAGMHCGEAKNGLRFCTRRHRSMPGSQQKPLKWGLFFSTVHG